MFVIFYNSLVVLFKYRSTIVLFMLPDGWVHFFTDVLEKSSPPKYEKSKYSVTKINTDVLTVSQSTRILMKKIFLKK